MVKAHRVAALETLGAHEIGDAVGQHVEIHAAVVVIQEEGIVKGLRLAGNLQVLGIPQHTMQDQVSQDALLLLPPGLAIMEGKAMPLLLPAQNPLHHIIPPRALAIHANRGHDLGDLFGQGLVFLLGL